MPDRRGRSGFGHRGVRGRKASGGLCPESRLGSVGGRIPSPGRARARERRDRRRGEALEGPRAGLRHAVARQQVVAEEEAHALSAPGGGSPQGARHVRGRVGADVAQRVLRAREDHGLAEAGHGVGERRARVAHGVGSVEHDEGVRPLGVGAQVVDDRLPRFGRGVRGVDERIELRQAHLPVELGPRDQGAEPPLEVGAGHEPVGGVHHADGSARVRDVYAHVVLPRGRRDARRRPALPRDGAGSRQSVAPFSGSGAWSVPRAPSPASGPSPASSSTPSMRVPSTRPRT